MIGSHNTMTYMRPEKCWMLPLAPTARCQRRAVSEQGIELADIRVRERGGAWRVSHGVVTYCTLEDALRLVSAAGVHDVRLLIEGGVSASSLSLLREALSPWMSAGMRFYCGRAKSGWVKLLDELPDIAVEQPVGSMQSWYGKVWPWLWWRLHRPQVNADTTALYDFL